VVSPKIKPAHLIRIDEDGFFPVNVVLFHCSNSNFGPSFERLFRYQPILVGNRSCE
jgi:hypothetical protein